MKRITATIAAMAIISGIGQPSMAQNGAAPIGPEMQKQMTVSNDRFERCIDNPGCSIRDRLRIMDSMDEDMRTAMERINKNCMMMNYNECVGPQREETRQWRGIHDRMGRMMQSMEMRSLKTGESATPAPEKKSDMTPREEGGQMIEMMEPAAGDAAMPRMEAPKRPWWNILNR